MIKISKKISAEYSESVAQVAVFAEGESMYRVRKNSQIASKCLSDIRRTLAECGASYDLYSISDIKLPSINKYKVFIFVNQYDIPEKIKEQIHKKCQVQGKTILWLYAPNYASGGQNQVDNISKITGISVGASENSHGGMIYKGKKIDFNLNAPHFFVSDNEATSIARFEDGRIAAASKNFNTYNSVYIATCNLMSELLRDILRGADVHIYSEQNQVYTYVNSFVIGVYNATDSDAVVNLQEDGFYKDLISEEIFECSDGQLYLPKQQINAFLLVKYNGTVNYK